MIRAIAFDLDGTIGETIPMCLSAFRRAVSPFAGHELSDEEIAPTLGLDEAGMIRRVVGARWEEALRAFYPVYKTMHAACPHPFEGIRELIHNLQSKGVCVGLITGKGEKSCQITLEQFGMQQLFSFIRTGSPVAPNKARRMRQVLAEYGWQKSEFCYVGDALSDVTAAAEAGITCLSAAWSRGARVRELERLNPGHVFLSIEKLRQHLLRESLRAASTLPPGPHHPDDSPLP